MSPFKTRSWRPKTKHWLIFASLVAAVVMFAHFVHPLLAVNAPVEADVLVVEGWVADAVLAQAAAEFNHGHYTLLLTSGLQFENDKNGNKRGSYAEVAAKKLSSLGVSQAVLVACPTPFVGWNRTSNSARAVRDALHQRGIHPKGINVLTAGPHGRETWVAYRHILSNETPIGIISIPNQTYNASYWWASHEGRRWVFKNIVGWPKEVLIGQRS